jgi:hypothetical protein
MAYTDMHSSKTGKGNFSKNEQQDKNMAKDAIIRLQETATKLIKQQKDLTVKPSESATMVANAKNSKSNKNNRTSN